MGALHGDIVEQGLKGVKRGVKLINFRLGTGTSTYLGDRLEEARDMLDNEREEKEGLSGGSAEKGLARLRDAALTKTSALPRPDDGQFPFMGPHYLEPGAGALSCASNRRLAEYFGNLAAKAAAKAKSLTKESEFIPVDRSEKRDFKWYKALKDPRVRLPMGEAMKVNARLDDYYGSKSGRPWWLQAANTAAHGTMPWQLKHKVDIWDAEDNLARAQAGKRRRRLVNFERIKPGDAQRGWYRAPRALSFPGSDEERRVSYRVARAQRRRRRAVIPQAEADGIALQKSGEQYDSLGKQSSPAGAGGGVAAPMPQTEYAKSTLENEYADRLNKRQLAAMSALRQQNGQNGSEQSSSTTTTSEDGTTTTTTTSGLSNSGLMAALSIGSTM